MGSSWVLVPGRLDLVTSRFIQSRSPTQDLPPGLPGFPLEATLGSRLNFVALTLEPTTVQSRPFSQPPSSPLEQACVKTVGSGV